MICRWIAVDAGDETVRRMMAPEISCFAAAGPSNAYGGYDPKFRQCPQLQHLPQPWSLAVTRYARAYGLRRARAQARLRQACCASIDSST